MDRPLIPLPVISAVADVLGDFYFSHTKIDSIFEQAGAPDPKPGGNCVNKVKAWLRAVNSKESIADPLHFLAEVLSDFMSKDPDTNQAIADGIAKITTALGRAGLKYDCEGGIATITSGGITAVTSARTQPQTALTAPAMLPLQSPPTSPAPLDRATPLNNRTSRDVFVVYGRNSAAHEALCTFLTSIDLRPLEWEEMVRRTGHASPYIGEVLKAGFANTTATVVLLTGDDDAVLRQQFHKSSDPQWEREWQPQPRPNVLIEAGMALALAESRTVLVQLGEVRSVSDILGRHVVHMNDTPHARKRLIERLRTAGCSVNDQGDRWLTAGSFDNVIAAAALRPLAGPPLAR